MQELDQPRLDAPALALVVQAVQCSAPRQALAQRRRRRQLGLLLDQRDMQAVFAPSARRRRVRGGPRSRSAASSCRCRCGRSGRCGRPRAPSATRDRAAGAGRRPVRRRARSAASCARLSQAWRWTFQRAASACCASQWTAVSHSGVIGVTCARCPVAASAAVGRSRRSAAARVRRTGAAPGAAPAASERFRCRGRRAQSASSSMSTQR